MFPAGNAAFQAQRFFVRSRMLGLCIMRYNFSRKAVWESAFLASLQKFFLHLQGC